MKANAYCYAHCSRTKRRTCKQDCRKLDVEKDNIERSLADIETFYFFTRKAAMSSHRRGDFYEVWNSDEMAQGRNAFNLWLHAIARDGYIEAPPSWRIPGAEYRYWNPRVMFFPHMSDSSYWDQDSKWLRENRDKAIEGGLDSMLDAYYAGVPYEDIVA